MSILEVSHVSIRYITGDFKDIGFKDYVLQKIRGNYHVTEFWADKDVSFTLERGEMLGIIGSNGAGKSTLLKAVSGIMVPTEGWIHREGTIAALLELRTRKTYVDRGPRDDEDDEWSFFDDDDEDE